MGLFWDFSAPAPASTLAILGRRPVSLSGPADKYRFAVWTGWPAINNGDRVAALFLALLLSDPLGRLIFVQLANNKWDWICICLARLLVGPSIC